MGADNVGASLVDAQMGGGDKRATTRVAPTRPNPPRFPPEIGKRMA
jgi:hypothetical protein